VKPAPCWRRPVRRTKASDLGRASRTPSRCPTSRSSASPVPGESGRRTRSLTMVSAAWSMALRQQAGSARPRCPDREVGRGPIPERRRISGAPRAPALRSARSPCTTRASTSGASVVQSSPLNGIRVSPHHLAGSRLSGRCVPSSAYHIASWCNSCPALGRSHSDVRPLMMRTTPMTAATAATAWILWVPNQVEKASTRVAVPSGETA